MTVLDTDRLSAGQVDRLRRLFVEELVEETDVGERPSGHDGVVASARAVRVVVTRTQTVRRHTRQVGHELIFWC